MRQGWDIWRVEENKGEYPAKPGGEICPDDLYTFCT